MADSKITALGSIGTGTDPANDQLVIVDVSDVLPTGMATTGTTKRVSLNNLLASSPTATLASATITGDLTVDTSTLKVDSTNNRVGIGTASPATILDIQSAGGVFARIQNTTSTADAYLLVKNTTGEGFFGINATGPYVYTAQSLPITFTTATSERYRIAADGVATWSNVGGVAGTAMTLNSTGLGVGVTPSAGKFEVLETGTGSGLGGIFASTATAGGNPGFVFRTASTNRWSISLTGTAGAESIRFYDVNAAATRMTLDSAGNLILQSSATPATLTVNGQLTVNATSNTNLRFSYRGSDGTTRVANITLA